MPTVLKGIDGIRAYEGFVLGKSAWLEIDPDMIRAFENAVVVEVCETFTDEPQRGESLQVAPCYLVVGLLLPLLRGVYWLEDTTRGAHYGIDELRFHGPVPSNSALRLVVTLRSVVRAGEGWELALACAMECDAATSPILTAIVRYRFEILESEVIVNDALPGNTQDKGAVHQS